ncbi:GntR family transcriptional regulator [Pygmaiobacter massiliensis]|uniref:GntR family transcriptional regulator n=1 Tax=Pygmaiobacter massiliensis TaxID=1917873 RepID=UPI000C7E66A8|nr:GntR family transcriptional regulator [Pygmaiobacter massiliensis]
MNNLRPIQLLPARERVAAAVRKAILTHELSQGTVITLDEIASQLEVSATPVREAFQILAREGLLVQRPNKVAEVQGITPKFIHDHYETRAVLESACARNVCLNHANLTEIQRAYEASESAIKQGDSLSYSNCNQAFHFAIWEASGNSKMKTLLSEMWNGLSIGQKITAEDYAKISIKEHEKILLALTQCDGQRAYEEMHAHIMRSMENIMTHFSTTAEDTHY